MGRGFIQTTGRFNYAKTRDRLRQRMVDVPDFEAEPQHLEEVQWACLSACDYWDSRNLNALADEDQFEQITRKINGGLNGYSDRLARWDKAKAVFNLQPVIKTLPDIERKEEAMPLPVFAAAALPLIVEAIPKLGKLFGSGSDVAERNVKAAEAVISIVSEAVGAKNAQDAVEALKDPAVAQVAQKAIEDRWYELSEAGGGGIAGARKHNAELMQSGTPLYQNPAIWISAVLLIFPGMLLIDVLFVHPENYKGELRVQIVTAVLAVIAMVGGYWLGTSFSSARKTELTGK